MYRKETNAILNEYESLGNLYKDYAEVVASLLKTFLTSAGIPYYAIDHRRKSLESLREKIHRKRSSGKIYRHLEDITDLAGVRVILFFSDDVAHVRDIVANEFNNVLSKSDYVAAVERRKKEVGYTAIHELVRINTKRSRLNEYKRFKNLTCEIQIKSILQHAWAEIEHDIGYKPRVKETDLERSRIRDLFKQNAKLLQKVDSNFVEIRERHITLLAEYANKVERNRLRQLPINYDTVRAYLSKEQNTKRVPRQTVLEMAEIAYINGLKNILELEEHLTNADTQKEPTSFRF